MRGWIIALLAATTLTVATPVAAKEETPKPKMSWIEATERLQREKGAAVNCARVAKRHLPANDKAALSRIEFSYETARTEVMAVVAGLEAGLIDDSEKLALTDLSKRLEAGSAARDAFCIQALASIPGKDLQGMRNVAVEAALGLVKTLVDAGVTIWKEIRDGDKIRRANLRTALEDAKWPAFKDIAL